MAAIKERVNKIRHKLVKDDGQVIKIMSPDGSLLTFGEKQIFDIWHDFMDAVRNGKPIPKEAIIIGESIGCSPGWHLTPMVRMLVKAYWKYGFNPLKQY